MKPMLSSNSLVRADSGTSLSQKLLMSSLIFVLMLASLPVQGAFAATPSNKDLEREWRDKIRNVDIANLFYLRVRVYPADFEDPDELARAHELMNNYGIELRAAQTLIFNHTGFNSEGKVINEIQANQSIKEVASRLHTMRGLQKKLDELEGNYRLLPVAAVVVTTSQ